MGLRIRLLTVTIAVAVLVTILFGIVAYRITTQSTLERESAALAEKARLLAAHLPEFALNDHPEKTTTLRNQLRHALLPWLQGESLGLFTAPGLHLTIAARPADDDYSLALRLAKEIKGESAVDGFLAINDKQFLWTTVRAKSGVRIRLIRQTDVVDETLSVVARRLLLTGLAAVWVALWGGLILTAVVAKRQERHDTILTYRANHDELTGLTNRHRLQQILNHAVTCRDDGALLVMDLDRFKEVNDTLGHNYGDALLRELGPSLLACLTEDDVLARLGGDEFAIWLPGATPEKALTVAQQVIAMLDTPLSVKGMSLKVDISIGVACFPLHAQSMEALVRCADVAMYHAKKQRLGAAIYTADDDHHSIMRLRLASEIPKAISEAQFVLYYQPKINVASGGLSGVEALTRWQHPDYGLLTPDKFTDLAEQSGLIQDFTFHVLEEALAQCARWRSRGLDCPVSVNLSPFNLQHPDLVGKVIEAIERHRLPPAMLELELTETAAMADIDHTVAVFTALKAGGVELAIDDFGTGMSSLSYLSLLPACAIKIDRSFVMGMSSNPKNDLIVGAIVTLAANLGRSCVAEGVEDVTTLSTLRQMGCHFAQGYAIGHPRPADERLFGELTKLATIAPNVALWPARDIA